MAAFHLPREEIMRLPGPADPSLPVPDVHLLSNGRYHVMIDSAGSGCS